MGKHHSWGKALIFSVNVVILLCLLSSSLLFSTHSRTASANDSVFYDFITQAQSASWSSGAGSLPFPGSDNDKRGFALYRDNFQLEDNSTWARALETHPEWVSDGWIMGIYPQMTVPSDAEFKVTVGFLKGATGTTGVIFEVRFEEFLLPPMVPEIYTIISHGATYDGELDSITADLSSLEGKTGNFILYVNAGQAAGRDWATWAEAKIEIAAPDTTAPEVTISRSPLEVTTADTVTFTAQARDDSSVDLILIFVNGQQVKLCSQPSPKTDDQGGEYYECSYTGGPYPEGPLTYWAEAIDIHQNLGVSLEESVDVTISITPPPLTDCWFFISGTIHDFPYHVDTLEMKVCETETITYTPGPEGTPLTLTQCKEGGRVWYADVIRLMEEDVPGPDLYYYIGGLCPGEYKVMPLLNPAAWCEWQGSWETAKGQEVRIEDSSAEGFDFTFTLLDTHTPEIPLIQVEPEQPEYDDPVTVTILANDDREIVGIREKTDTLGLDGSYNSDDWHSLTVVPGMEGSTAGAQFSFIANVAKATITVRVCDIGGNIREAEKVIICGSCSDKVQNAGETGIDCGGPCPSQCVECIVDQTVGEAPSAYLFSLEDGIVQRTALEALQAWADNQSICVDDLFTGDPYGITDNLIRAVTWYIHEHMGWRHDDTNRSCLNAVMPSPYDPADYGHTDFPVPAAYTLRYSGAAYVSDPTKDYFGDCEDFAILETAMLRSLGVGSNCIFVATQPSHALNVVYYEGKYRCWDPQHGIQIRETDAPEFIFNDRIGASYWSDFKTWRVNPWEYTMNYPGCERPTVTVSGGGFGSKELWLDWDGWGEHCEVAVGDFGGDGRDDLAAVWYEGGDIPYKASVLFSTGSGFLTPSGSIGPAMDVDFTPLVARGRTGDYIVAPKDNVLCCVEGCGFCPRVYGYWSHFYYDDPVTGVVALGDPDGDGRAEAIEMHKDAKEVWVNGIRWVRNFSPGDEIPLVGDFDGDDCDDVVSFNRRWAAVRVIRAVPDKDKFTMACIWHEEFCSDDEIPGVGDFNGDGRDDIVAFNLGNKDVFVGLSTLFGFWSDGFGLTQSRWHDDFCSEDDTPLVGDFNGDGLDDIACFSLDDGRARVWVSLADPSTMTYDFHGGCPCEQAHFYTDAYLPSICP